MGLFEQAARRRRAAEMERRLAELDEWDRVYGLGGVPRDTTWRYHSPDGQAPIRAFDASPQRATRRRRRPRRGRWVLLVLVLALVSAAYAFPEEASTVRHWASAAGRSIVGAPAEPVTSEPAPEQGPTPGALDRIVDTVLTPQVPRLGGWEPPRGERVLPAVDPGRGGSFAFIRTQPGTDVPVGFSPCGPIPVEVNPDGAPWGYTDIVESSLDRVRAASGLDLVLLGETSEVWSQEPRELGSPVVISWSEPDTVPELAGATAGLGGATTVQMGDGTLWHAGGAVVLDASDLSTWEHHSAVLDHELGHVLGLDHVADDGELMAAVNMAGTVNFGPGDLAGLAALGAIDCPA